MSWAAVIGTAVGRIAATAAPAEPTQSTCEGCGAALRPQVMVCDHCRRPRRGAEKTPGYPQRLYDETARRFAETSPPAPYAWTPVPSMPPAPAYEPPAPAPVPEISSGGGGDFSGGGASGDW